MGNNVLNAAAKIKASPTSMLKDERWVELRDYYRLNPAKVEYVPGNKQHIMFNAISQFRTGHYSEGLSLLSDDILQSSHSRKLLRQWVIPALVVEKPAMVLRLTRKLLTSGAGCPEDMAFIASHFIRRKMSDSAARVTMLAWDVFPDDGRIYALHLRSMTLAGHGEQALAIARQQLNGNVSDPDRVYTGLYYLNKSTLPEDKALAVSRVHLSGVDSPERASLKMEILNSVGRFKEAIQAGEAALAVGIDSMTVRRALGAAFFKSGRSTASKNTALIHFRQAVAFEPDNLRVATFLADALVRTGNNAEAISLLARWLNSYPDLSYIRSLYARALRQQGDYSSAGDEFMTLALEGGPASKWNRYASAALIQAGRRDEAESLFECYTQSRSASLATDFEEGLKQLDDRVADVSLPAERLAWAWEMGGKSTGIERGEWERRAKWGYLADNYLLDWLECRGEKVDEAMDRLADLGKVERFFADLKLDKRGCIIVSAHMGAMYAGPMILSLLDIRSKWVASTPGLLSGGYGERLISVSDKSEGDVVKACMQTLQGGQSLVVAIDGALSLSAPTIEFLGQSITYSSFCSRLVYKMHLPAVFGVPVWREGKIDFVLEKMVSPERFESLESFTERWKQHYLKCLTMILRDAPENLRLSGGIWRNIVAKDA